MRVRIALCLLVGSIAGLVFFRIGRVYPEHAFLVGLAIAALTYSLLRAIDNLRRVSGKGSPGNQEHTGDE